MKRNKKKQRELTLPVPLVEPRESKEEKSVRKQREKVLRKHLGKQAKEYSKELDRNYKKPSCPPSYEWTQEEAARETFEDNYVLTNGNTAV